MEDCRAEEMEMNQEEEKLDINKADKSGLTPLHAAGIGSGKEIVELLCRVRGIKLNQKDKFGRTPLMIAVMINNIEAVKVLVKQETIDLETCDNKGKTLDDFAHGKKEITELLYQARRHWEKRKYVAMELMLHQETLWKKKCDQQKKHFRKRLYGKWLPKEKNVEQTYSSEKVDNYQGNFDIDTILDNIENGPTPKPKVMSKEEEEEHRKKFNEKVDMACKKLLAHFNINEDAMEAKKKNNDTPKTSKSKQENMDTVNSNPISGEAEDKIHVEEKLHKESVEEDSHELRLLAKQSENIYENEKNEQYEVMDKVIVDQPRCHRLGCSNVSLHRCSRCHLASFCSEQCSLDFWPEHRKDCKKQPLKNSRKNSLSEVD